MRYVEKRPGPALAPYVEKLWCCEGYPAAHRRERVLPIGRAQLIVDLAGGVAIIAGIRTTFSILDTASVQCVAGAVFRPGGTVPFFDAPAHEFCERAVALQDLWTGGSGRLRQRMLEARGAAERLGAIEAQLECRLSDTPMHGAVCYALEEFRREASAATVVEVARGAGLSRRRLAALFREQVGLAPKLYCRLRRFRQVVRAVASGGDIDWAQISLAGGYYDQAHMAHEFREFSGVSPGAWRASERPFLNHAAIG